MSILGRVLLSSLVLLGCQGTTVPAKTPSRHTILLQESIRLLQQLHGTQVSCNEKNVTNIFADNKTGDKKEILRKAHSVVLEVQSCHKYLEGLSDNLRGLAQRNEREQKNPYPAAAESTTSLKNFLKELHRVLQEKYKSLN